MWKMKVGHHPTELIEFAPLNSAEFLILKKGNKAKKELPSLQIKWGVSQLLPSIMMN
jgi:hypothetical protein